MPRTGVVALAALTAALALEPAASARAATFVVELELGPVWQSRNSVRIPNDESGTRFSLLDVAGTGPWLGARLNLGWNVTERHSLRAVLAPLSFTETGSWDRPVSFVGETFEPGVATEATYRFNSWRLGYRYRWLHSDRWTVWVGGAAKVRDAKIELRQGTTSASDSDMGFVPLLHLAADWRFAEGWKVSADLDGLAGGPGRAIDLGLDLGYDVSERWTIAAGYRTLEGGADTDDVYNFAWFHAAVISATYRF